MSTDNLALVREYLAAIEAGATGDALARFYWPDAIQHELPNRLVPAGATRDLPAILDAAVRGQKIVATQRFTLKNAVADGDRVALELDWEATFKVPLGALAAGSPMRAHFAMFLQLRDGRIVAQRNYDCFEPW
jgi:ketosteroid isomerase-like protein